MEGIERIKALSSDIKDKPLLKIIDYLLDRTDMDNKYLNDKKTLKGMIDFIKSEAEKLATNGVAMLEDEEVYGMAIHYFDESNEDLGIEEDVKPDTTDDEEEDAEEPIQKLKTPIKNISEGQLTLF
jgi:hypothetical protein